MTPSGDQGKGLVGELRVCATSLIRQRFLLVKVV